MDAIKVVMVEPGKTAIISEISTNLEAMQEAVGGGYIETCYPFPDSTVCLVCNDSGKYNGMRPCRAIRNQEGKVSDIIFGPFFICGAGIGQFESLDDEQLQKYLELFFYPEVFIRTDKMICAIQIDPESNKEGGFICPSKS